jgi:hypothetical protein
MGNADSRNQARIAKYRRLLRAILGRTPLVSDGVRESRLRRAEKRLDLILPAAMRDYYLLAGAAAENREHNRLFAPEELAVEESHLIFMEENQAVVHWCIPLASMKRADPEVWQRVNNDVREWYSEQMTFSVFIVENLAWQRGIELSSGRTRREAPGASKRRRSASC